MKEPVSTGFFVLVGMKNDEIYNFLFCDCKHCCIYYVWNRQKKSEKE